MSVRSLVTILKGGSGSGNFGHSGRPGKIGGSSGGQSSVMLPGAGGKMYEVATNAPLRQDKYKDVVKALGWDTSRSRFSTSDPKRSGYTVQHPADKNVRLEGYTNSAGIITEGMMYGPSFSKSFDLRSGDSIPSAQEALDLQK